MDARSSTSSMPTLASARSSPRPPRPAWSSLLLADVDTSLLVHERELDLLRSLQELPDIVRVACVDNARIASPRGRVSSRAARLLPRPLCHE